MKHAQARLAIGILVVAWVATIGDYIWYEGGVRHRMIAGLIHGAGLLTAVGGVLGWTVGRPLPGLPLGAVAGLGGALAYYALQPALGGTPAMLAAWASLWVLLSVLDAKFVRRGARSVAEALSRGALAAVFSGLAFWLVVGVVWGRPPAGGRNYLVQFAAWAVAFAPGLIALGLERRRDTPKAA